MYNILKQQLQYLPGVGPRKAMVLASEVNIKTVGELLLYFPYKYVDRSIIYKINQLNDKMPFVQLKGRITSFSEEGVGRSYRLEAEFSDQTGSIRLVWFQGVKYIKKKLKTNTDYILLGKPTLFNFSYTITHPEMEELSNPNREIEILGLHPVYHTTEKMKRTNISSKFLENLIVGLFKQIDLNTIDETIPSDIRSRYHLMPLAEAIFKTHLPTSMEDLPAAQYRHKFEELFFLQLGILSCVRRRSVKYAGFRFDRVGCFMSSFYREKLPFQLTGAQKRVMQEIRNDLFSGRQMNRLIQGDVGSGKTIIAVMTMLLAADNGFQSCLMAPTEILAEQHFNHVSSLLSNMGLNIALLTGAIKNSRRKTLYEQLKTGEIHIVIGTHALLEDTVSFKNLGCAIIDEQHRFGVEQRSKLWHKNQSPPHILVMTATPIPRTLAMTLYGDLDVSIIDELPPGRKPIQTHHVYENNMNSVYKLVFNQLSLKRQVYIVYPLIKESEKIDLQDLEQGFETFRSVFPNSIIGKIHGQMKEDEKNEIMQHFTSGEIQILLSTTVIEVGVNVPNASLMIIVNADRFGLSQLHQLRGRVGRGADQSYCVLVTKRKLSENTLKRMEVMTTTNDGFLIAEEDLRLRGPGDIEGTRQSGLFMNIKYSNLAHDAEILEDARQAADYLINKDPGHTSSQYLSTWNRLSQLRGETQDYSVIS